MKTELAWRAGVATDPGLERTINEDRVFVDDAHGVFLVVDGLGGHAAGEMAAETAKRVIAGELAASIQAGSADIEESIRQAIADANNRIYELAQSNPEWQGMACVLTLAVLHDDQVLVGHVGDSRLYLFWNGNLRKLTSDHSPVGEQEDQGELTEQQAMRHPRRNEVFRDVGSRPRPAHDPDFIEIRNFRFRPDAALLLCSDGLSDLLTSTQIRSIVERYDGDPDRTAQQLVQSANQAGGTDNVSVVFVAGPEFLGSESNAMLEVRSRHAITRMRNGQPAWRSILAKLAWLIVGMLLGIALWASLERLTPRQPPSKINDAAAVRPPAHITANPTDPLGIVNALGIAHPGDIVDVPPGQYLGPVTLKEHVNVIASAPGQAIVRCDPAATTDTGIGLVARGVNDVRVQGLSIVSDDAHPLRTGLLIDNASPQVDDIEISGAVEAAVRITSASYPVFLASYIHGNPGAAIVVKDTSAPRFVGNTISENGAVPGALQPALDIDASARPEFERNLFARNGLVFSRNLGSDLENAIRSNNVFAAEPRPSGRGKSHGER